MHFLAVCVLGAMVVSAASAQLKDIPVHVGWEPVTDAERSLTKGKIDPEAGLEALFWRVHILDEILSGGDLQRAVYHHLRLKIFNQAGKEQASAFQIVYGDTESVLSVEGRTVRPDGTVVELGRDGIRDREVFRVGRFRRKAKQITMPAAEPGAIVEYRWKQIQHKPTFKYTRLQFQREYPVHSVTYYFKPLSHFLVATPELSLWPFNCKPSPLALDRRGLNFTRVDNVPAFREEPMMPAEPNLRAWALLFYHEGRKRDAEAYWIGVGKSKFQELKHGMKSSDEVKKATAAAIANATDDVAKVRAVLQYIRAHVRDLMHRSVTESERNQVIKAMMRELGRTAGDVLKSGIAWRTEFNTLAAAMLTEAGLESRPVLVGDRNDILFNPAMTEEYFLPNVDVAVRHGEQWKLYDVLANKLPAGMVSWREEGMPVLVTDPKKPSFVLPALSPPQASLVRRIGRFRLTDDGTLSGTAAEWFSGHKAADKRDEFLEEPAERHAEILSERIRQVFPNAKLSEVRVENVDDAEKPVTLRYTIEVPGYAQATGKRLFFAPVFFQRGTTPLFTAGQRTWDVHFPYAWQEQDNVEIEFPEGYALDAAENPGDVNFGGTGGYNMQMLVVGSRKMICNRELIFGREGQIGFPKTAYEPLKKGFDIIHSRDNHTQALRRQ